jgi:HSP20 family protein
MSRPGAQDLPVNAFETDEEVVVVAAMPGVEPQDIAIRLEGHTLHLESDVRGQDAQKRYIRQEWSYGPYRRAVPLPIPVDAQAANVTFGNGVLTIVFPKASEFVPAALEVPKTGPARGLREGHAGGGESGFHPPRTADRARG